MLELVNLDENKNEEDYVIEYLDIHGEWIYTALTWAAAIKKFQFVRELKDNEYNRQGIRIFVTDTLVYVMRKIKKESD